LLSKFKKKSLIFFFHLSTHPVVATVAALFIVFQKHQAQIIEMIGNF